jgi:arabinofuranosyltransferase
VVPYATEQQKRRPWGELAAAVITVAAGVVLVLHARSFLPFMADDAFISLRYAERLLAGEGLTWTDGERVEGYSNLLWVLTVAGLSKLLSLDLIVAARAVGLGSTLAALVALALAFRPGPPRRLLPLAAALSVLALSGPLVVWAIGGLEQPLLAGLLAWALVLTRRLAGLEAPSTRDLLAPGACLGLICICRPDGPLLAAAVGLGLLLGRGPGRASLWLVLRLGMLPLAFTAGQLLFRYLYYGDWISNTAHAKLGLTAHRIREGLIYLESGGAALPVLPLALAILGALLATTRRAAAAVLLSPLLIWTAYVAVVGGDIFPAYRHLVVAVTIAALAVGEGLDWLVAAPGRARVAVAGVLAAGTMALAFFPGWRHPELRRARDERWEWLAQPMGNSLRRAFGRRRPLLAADSAGCLPFFSKLPALDLLGLNDRHLATHPPPDFGRGYLGHELGDGAYTLGRKPDLIFFCGPLGATAPCFRSGREMVARPEFATSYRAITLQSAPPERLSASVFVRIHGAVGVSAGAREIRLPGYVLAQARPPEARIEENGQVWTRLAGEAGLTDLKLPAGSWKIQADADGPLLVQLRAADSTSLAEGTGVIQLDNPEERPVQVRVVPGAGKAVSLGSVVLMRER